ncbi:hypothetical protein C1645_792733 [Glomus cerebriforme]|uniref:Uncharacterized protein n=1 Tax=Glomus cerebriforme TaxID=658196 RepID=A0A397S6L6_9GLOM|nr:hypothetical protein C1645_792733 [Glomus cerebriforme]
MTLIDNLNCNIRKNHYEHIILTAILILFTILLTCHSTVLLWKYWIKFSNNMNRRTVIKLGEAARLCVWCITFLILLLLSLIPHAIKTKHRNPDNMYYNQLIAKICDFGSALIGTFLFLVFGTQKKAAVFLPCCYYVPPGTPHFSPFTFSDETMDENNTNELAQLPEVHLRQK